MEKSKVSCAAETDESEDDEVESRLAKTILKLEEIDKNIYR